MSVFVIFWDIVHNNYRFGKKKQHCYCREGETVKIKRNVPGMKGNGFTRTDGKLLND